MREDRLIRLARIVAALTCVDIAVGMLFPDRPLFVATVLLNAGITLFLRPWHDSDH